jgi:phosphinothricin acetyltransferase
MAEPMVAIRPSGEADVGAMLAIYVDHIHRGLGDHAAEPIDPDDLKRQRKTMVSKRLPHLVAEVDGMVVGYAYAVPFRKRPAYRYTVKHSIYIRRDWTGRGLGPKLMQRLIDACAAAGFHQMIGYIDAANQPSLTLHDRFGFERVGYLKAVGFKFGHWTDTVMVQRPLGSGAASSPQPGGKS